MACDLQLVQREGLVAALPLRPNRCKQQGGWGQIAADDDFLSMTWTAIFPQGLVHQLTGGRLSMLSIFNSTFTHDNLSPDTLLPVL